MTVRFELRIETHDGMRGLERVVGVLARYDITPVSLSLQGDAENLRMDFQLEGDLRNSELCIGKMQTLVSVTSAIATPTWSMAFGERCPCATAPR